MVHAIRRILPPVYFFSTFAPLNIFYTLPGRFPGSFSPNATAKGEPWGNRWELFDSNWLQFLGNRNYSALKLFGTTRRPDFCMEWGGTPVVAPTSVQGKATNLSLGVARPGLSFPLLDPISRQEVHAAWTWGWPGPDYPGRHGIAVRGWA